MAEEDSSDVARLVALARAGDGAAFAALVRPHLAPMTRLACVISGSPADAEDIMQESLTSLFRSLKRFDDARPLAPWFATIVVNRARNSRRGQSRRRLLFSKLSTSGAPTFVATDDALVARVDEHVDSGTGESGVLGALRALSADDQAVLVLRHITGLSEAETSSVLNVAVGTVKSRNARALTRLRTQLASNSPPIAENASARGER